MKTWLHPRPFVVFVVYERYLRDDAILRRGWGPENYANGINATKSTIEMSLKVLIRTNSCNFIDSD